jgi:hypothetical protein
MEVTTKAGSPIALMTMDRTMGGGKQEHKIRWVPLPGCPDGYIIQRITRDTKTSHGKQQNDERTGLPNGKVTWGKPTEVRGDYLELWEVWRGGVYPSKSSATVKGMFHSHAGLRAKDWFGETYIDPEAPPTRARGVVVTAAPAVRSTVALEPAEDVFHDVFTDKVPDCMQGQVIKGTNKILGKVFFIPRDSRIGAAYLKNYLEQGRRNKDWSGVFTGGILLQCDAATVPEPDERFLCITRYEAIEFSGSYAKKEIFDRSYPGLMRKKGQGVVNARNANFTYGPGTSVGPAGTARV